MVVSVPGKTCSYQNNIIIRDSETSFHSCSVELSNEQNKIVIL